jgi:hypothetical protein
LLKSLFGLFKNQMEICSPVIQKADKMNDCSLFWQLFALASLPLAYENGNFFMQNSFKPPQTGKGREY